MMMSLPECQTKCSQSSQRLVEGKPQGMAHTTRHDYILYIVFIHYVPYFFLTKNVHDFHINFTVCNREMGLCKRGTVKKACHTDNSTKTQNISENLSAF